VNTIIDPTSSPAFYTAAGGFGNRPMTMAENAEPAAAVALPSAWIARFAPLIRPGGLVLDLAAGSGRHTRLLLDRGFAVRAVDRDVAALRALAGSRCELRAIDLETGAAWPLGGGYDGIVVANYLHRPLLPSLAAALASGGVLIYETFALGNERLGRSRNPDFLLRPGELLQAFATLTVVAFEQVEVAAPRPAIIQRICARAGPVGRLPDSPV
jgi:SAM-dependent methyltransferase